MTNSNNRAKTGKMSSCFSGEGRIGNRLMRIRPLFLATCFPALVLAGCANHSENNFTVGSVQSTYKTKHPIVIDEKAKTLDVPVPSSSYDLPTPAQSSIQGFASDFQGGANGVVTVMVPAGSANEAAARTIAPKVVAVLVSSGIPRRRVRTSSYYASESGSSAPIRLSYTSLQASVEECGKWPEDLAGPNSDNQNYHNFGCAYQNNLAAMVANPADLLGPRGMTPIDAERRNVAIETYRDGDVGTGNTIGSVFE